MSVFSVVAFIYGKTALGWLAVWFCILFSVLLVLRQVHGRGEKGLMTGKGLFRVDRRYLLCRGFLRVGLKDICDF